MLESLGIASLFGVLGIVLSVVGYFLFDLAEWRIDFAGEIKKGNIAASIVIAAFIIGICFIVGRAIGS
jgi:putative membrane protein